MAALSAQPYADDVSVYSYCISQGNAAEAKRLRAVGAERRKAAATLKKLEAEAIRFYDNLEDRKEEIDQLFRDRFGATSTAFDKDSHTISITLPRDVATYSTGEINLMMVAIKLAEFEAGEKSILVFDDPLSSLDTANQYVIMFGIMQAVAQGGKSAILLTHSFDCINIAHSQNNKAFSYHYMECENNLINLRQIDTKPDSKGPSSPPMSPIRIISTIKHGHCGTEDICGLPQERALLYLDAAEARENAKERKEEDGDEGESKDEKKDEGATNLNSIVHYAGPATVSFRENSLSNLELVGIIDSFPSPGPSGDFYVQSATKALLLLALRVWVEKQLFDHNQEDLKGKSSCSLGVKIETLFPRRKPAKWKGPKTVTRSFLMSKKTMLNQNAHVNAQAEPFEYAMSISMADITREIEQIKEAFSIDGGQD